MNRFSLVLSFVAGAGLLVPATSFACGNSYRYELEHDVNLLVKAERDLRDGMYDAALQKVASQVPTAGTSVVTPTKFGKRGRTKARALKVAAVATLRLKGETLPLGLDIAPPVRVRSKFAKSAGPKRAKGKAAAAKQTWAVKQLAVLAKQKPRNATLSARYAEGLATQGATEQAEALKTLEKLAKGDRMPDAHAWRTLAELRAGAGNADGAESALNRCKTIAKRKAICTLPATKTGAI